VIKDAAIITTIMN